MTLQWYETELLKPLLASFKHWPADNQEQLAQYSQQLGSTLLQYGWLQSEQQALLQQVFLTVLPRWLAPYSEQAPSLISQLLNTLARFPTITSKQNLLQRFEQCLPTAANTGNTLLVLSWLNGLAQYRTTAIEVLQQQPELVATLGFSSTKALHNPWWQGDQLQLKTTPVEVGSMSWLGGRFDDLPWIEYSNEQVIINAGARRWQLFADAFGTHLHSLPTPEPHEQPCDEDLSQFTLQLIQFNRYLRAGDRVKQVLELPHSYLLSFKTSYRLLIIPKQGNRL